MTRSVGGLHSSLMAPQPWPCSPGPAALAPLPQHCLALESFFQNLGEDSSVSHPGKHLVMEGDTCGWGTVSAEVCGGAILPVSQPQVKDRVSFPILEEVSSSCSWTGISGGSFLQLGVFIAILSCFFL